MCSNGEVSFFVKKYLDGQHLSMKSKSKLLQELPGCVDVPNSVPTAAVVHATVISGATGATLASRDLGCRSASCPLTWVEPSPTVPHRRN